MLNPDPFPSLPADARRAALTLVASSGLFGMMAIGARLASARIPGPQIALVRFLTGIAALLLAVAIGRAQLRPRRWGWLLARGLFGGTAVYLYFSCIEHVGVGVATLLNYTAPVWSLLFGWWLLGERPRRAVVGALVLTLVGVVFVVGGKVARFEGGWWTLAGALSAVASGVAVTSIRAVRRGGTESAWTVFASFTVLGAVATLPGVTGPLGRWVAPTAAEWLLLLAVGGFSIVAQLLMTGALEHVTAVASGIIHQLVVVITMTAGLLLFGETLSAWSLVGSALTMAGVVWTVLSASRPPPPAVAGV